MNKTNHGVYLYNATLPRKRLPLCTICTEESQKQYAEQNLSNKVSLTLLFHLTETLEDKSNLQLPKANERLPGTKVGGLPGEEHKKPF